MKTVESISRMSTLVDMLRREGKSIGFVPTMGYLHEGHLSLVKTAKKHTDVVVMSIFINPKQFGPGEDFEKYPRDMKRDEAMAAEAGVDIIFFPKVSDMYPEGYATYVDVEGLTEMLCGLSRQGHFKGVTTVVAKLFGIVKPDVAYFGQKDAQQAIIIRKMVADLNMDIEVKILQTVREKDGLAMSSRNIYLSAGERKDAVAIYRSLVAAEALIKEGERDTKRLIKAIRLVLSEVPNLRIDYVSVVDAGNLHELSEIAGDVLVAVAVFIGRTRLIDNVIVKASQTGSKAEGMAKR